MTTQIVVEVDRTSTERGENRKPTKVGFLQIPLDSSKVLMI